jgi:hypothetical protein
MQSTRHSCPVVMIFEFSQQIFESFSNIIFHENPSSVHAERRKDWHDEANNRFSQFLRTRLKL